MAKAKTSKKVTRKLSVKKFNEVKKYLMSIAEQNTKEEESVTLLSSTKDKNRTIPIEWQIVEFKTDYKGNTQKGLYIDAVHSTESVKGQTLDKYYRQIKNAIRNSVYEKIEEQKGLVTGYANTTQRTMWLVSENGRHYRQKAYEITQNNDKCLSDNYVAQVKAILEDYVAILNKDFNEINECMILDYENRKKDFEEYKQTLTADKRNGSYIHTLSLDEYKLYKGFQFDYIHFTKATDIQKQTEEKAEPKVSIEPTFKNTKASL